MGMSPLPERTRPAQLLLCVGAVVLVAAGAAALGAAGIFGRGLLIVLSLVAAGSSIQAARSGLHATEETLAGCAAGLAVFGTGALERPAGAVPAAGLAAAFLAAYLFERSTRTWLLASWAAFQLAALHLLPGVHGIVHTGLILGVALVGLALTFTPGTLVPRAALITTAPWHVVGVLAGCRTAWTADPASRWTAAALVAGAGAGLVVARMRPVLDPLLGPERAAPLVAGALTGVALTGAAGEYGPIGMTAAGYAGLLAAALVPEFLEGPLHPLLSRVAVAGGAVMALLALGRLAAGAHWTALVALLLLTSLPSALVAGTRPAERKIAVPVTVGCLAAAALLAVPAGGYGPGTAAALVTAVFAAALAVDAVLPHPDRAGAEATAAVCAAAAVAVLAVDPDRRELAVVLAVQGLLSVGWALGPARGTPAAGRGRAAGAAELVAAAWLGVQDAGWHVVEGYTVPLALGLLLAAGPRLLTGPSWPAWGPGLLVLALPSAVLAVVEHGSTRPVLVLLASAAAMVIAPRTKVRAPLLVGAGTAVTVSVGLAAAALPWPIGVGLVTGALLLAVGARRERFPVAGFGLRLAQLR